MRPPRPGRATRRSGSSPTVALLCSVRGAAAPIERTARGMAALQRSGASAIVHHDGSDVAGFERLAASGGAPPSSSAPTYGVGHGLTLALERTEGEVVICVPAGAELIERGIVRLAEAFSDPRLDAAYGDRVISAEGREAVQALPRHDDRILDWIEPGWPGPLAVRRTSWERAGARFEPDLDHHWGFELLLRLRGAGARIAHVRAATARSELPRGPAAEAAEAEAGAIRRELHGRSVGPEELERALRKRRRRIATLSRIAALRARFGAG